MKKIVVIALLIVITGYVFAAGKSEAGAGGAVEIKFAHYLAESHPAHDAALAFAKAVNERTDGIVTVTIFPNSMLGNSQELVEQTTNGALDLVIPTEPAIAKYVKKFNMVGAPFAFKDYAATDKLFAGDFIKWVTPDLEDVGLKYLARWEYGFRNYTTSVHQINTPADMQGLKIRTPPDFVNSATVKALGGVSQTIAFTELPMALKQGVVDGQENPIATILTNKMYETQKYLSMVNYTYNSTHLLMNIDKFKSLSAKQQKIILEEAEKAGLAMQKAVREKEADQIKELEAQGMEVAYPDTKPFITAAAPVYEELKAQVGEADFDYYMDLLGKSRR
ncbi:TRAP transporter substrate-binding protein [Marispirochaeta sp.]|uniref:TRAP transporter substrate-binding protein n=1 Tax=Marispirochaeta sp. TaxID=2038653 RepID=UPI0029C7CCA8|nr:TRAP transporter substrate-binding protein [Marispirochaeta sp.]